MRFAANEQTLPRLHLIGTLAIVLLLTVTLGGYFSWRSTQDHRASLQRLAETVQVQQQARLSAELDSAASFLEFTRSRTEDVLRKSLREQVDTAMQVAQAIYDQESPKRSAAEVKQLVIEALRQARFYAGRGYYFIDDMQGKFILMPTAPQLEGKTSLDNRDDNGHYIMRGLIDAARKPDGEGYSRYRWYTPDDPKVMADKLAYVRYFAPFDWLIGTGDYTYKWEQLQKQEVIARLRALKFGNSGYIGLLDRRGHLLLSPSDASLEGKPPQNMLATQSAALMQLMATAQAGGGMVHYPWQDRVSGNTLNKMALVRLVEPWGWVLAATIQDDEIQAAVQAELSQHSLSAPQRWRNLLWLLMLALAFGLAASWVFTRWSHKLLQRYHADMLAKNRAVADSETLFHAVFDNAAVGMAQVAPNGLFIQINPQFCKLIGYTRDEVLLAGFDFQKVTLPEDLPADLAQVQRLLDGRDDSYSLEKRYVHKDGHLVWVDLAVHLVRDATGTPRYFILVVNDITDRKQSEQALQLAATVFSHAREGS